MSLEFDVTSTQIAAIAEEPRAQAREYFWAFRRLMRPKMRWGWWVEEVALHLQKFYKDFEAGKRPKLALMAPPQHGKSWAAEDLMAWAAGKDPDCKIIFASFSADLGIERNLNLQRLIMSPTYQLVFPNTRIGTHGWVCNTEMIEFVNHAGSFRNTTIEGQINGKELHLGVIDDPFKGRADAMSKTVRDRTWNWYADDFRTRFADEAAQIVIMTRWHVDDLLGRILEREQGWKVLRYEALATKKERHRDPGEPLFEEHKSLDFLLSQRKIMSEASWESEYQQHPIVVGGGIFPIDKIGVVPVWDSSVIDRSVRYWDKAGTTDDGAYTAGVLMHLMRDRRFVISHVARGRWSALEREQHIKTWAERDAAALKSGGYEIVVEQEPGSGGKESAEATIRNLAGFSVFADRATGSKEVRAQPFAGQVQGGNVWLVAGTWNADLLEEMETFPSGRYRDQIDAAVGAFNRIVLGPQYSLWSGWLD